MPDSFIHCEPDPKCQISVVPKLTRNFSNKKLCLQFNLIRVDLDPYHEQHQFSFRKLLAEDARGLPVNNF